MSVALESVMQLLGLTLLHFLWQGLLIGVAFLILMRLLCNATAQTRYVCAVATLVLIFITPIVTYWWLFSQASGGAAAVLGASAPDAIVSMAAVTATAAQGQLPWYIDWLPIVVCVWLAGVLMLTGRMAMDARYVSWLKRSADTRLPIEIEDAMERFCEQLRLSRRRIGLGITPHVSTALVVGWLRPMVLLPAAVIGKLPRQQLELILAHELAHIRRHDPIVNVFQVVVETVLFYHPVVRMVSRSIRVERENCTDDLVVQLSHDSMSYARALTALEELRGASIRLSIGAVDGDFARRIRRLFKPQPRRQKGMLSAGLISAVTALLMVFANVAAWQLQQWRDRQIVAVTAESEILVSETREVLDAEASLALLDLSEPPPPAVEIPSSTGAAPAVIQPEPDSVVTAAGRDVSADAVDTSVGLQSPATSLDVGGAGNTQPESPETATQPEPSSAGSSAVLSEAAVVEPTADLSTRLESPVQLAYVPPPPPAESETERPEPRLSGGRLLQMVSPDYPRRAMQRGLEAEVRLSFVIDSEGRPQDIQVIDEGSGNYGFGQAAERAVEAWRFEPFAVGGETVERRVEQVVAFSLTSDLEQCGPTTGTRINSRRFNSC